MTTDSPHPAGTQSLYLCLYQPDIPQNTGTMMRLAACLDIAIDIIGPTGFDMSDRALKRAGMDYLAHTALTKHISFSRFHNVLSRRQGRLILTTTKAQTSYTDFEFRPGDHILMGRESAGVPEDIHTLADARITVPMKKTLRSINVSLCAAMIVGEALRQLTTRKDFSSHDRD